MTPSRFGTRYDQLGQSAPEVEIGEGHSGYFRQPAEDFDPRLFEPGTEKMRPEIRQDLLRILYEFWAPRYNAAEEWSEAWVAGSSVSRLWSRDAGGKGDIDVLLGVDLPVFFWHNPQYRGFPESTLAQHMNAEFREHLWTALDEYMDGQFEVTYFYNPSTARDISVINPYAAYNLKADRFDVDHLEVPEDWGDSSVPREWVQAINDELERARTIIARYGFLRRQLEATTGPARVTVLAQFGNVVDQATAFYENIHAERRNAYQGRFGVPGQGFKDYYNYRWQSFKRFGVGKALNDIRRAGRDADRIFAEERYGAPIAQDVLTPATLKDYL